MAANRTIGSLFGTIELSVDMGSADTVKKK